MAKTEFAGGSIAVTPTDGRRIEYGTAIVKIGFLSVKKTFERLNVRLNDDGSIEIDPYFETSHQRIFAVGDVRDNIELIKVVKAEGIQAARKERLQAVARRL